MPVAGAEIPVAVEIGEAANRAQVATPAGGSGTAGRSRLTVTGTADGRTRSLPLKRASRYRGQ
jgi:hypothetical protein